MKKKIRKKEQNNNIQTQTTHKSLTKTEIATKALYGTNLGFKIIQTIVYPY